MEVVRIKELNCINESLFLALYVFNEGQEEIINYQELLKNEHFVKNYKPLIRYINKTREEAKKVCAKYQHLKELFTISETRVFTLTVLSYTRLANSINDYSFEEFSRIIKESILGTPEELGVDNIEEIKGEDFFKLIDKIDHLNDNQKVSLLRLFTDSSKMMKDFYDLLVELEKVVNIDLDSVLPLLKSNLDGISLDNFDDFVSLKDSNVYQQLKRVDLIVFIHGMNELGFSVDTEIEDHFIGLAMVGLIPYLSMFYKTELEDLKSAVYKKLKIVSEKDKFDIIYALNYGRMTIDEIKEETGITKNVISAELKTLQKERLITLEVVKGNVYYMINTVGMKRLLKIFADIFTKE